MNSVPPALTDNDGLARGLEQSPALGRERQNVSFAADEARIMLTTTCHSPSVALLAIGFANNGCAVSVLGPRDHPARKARAISRCLSYSALRPLHSIEAAVAAARPDLVIPCDERAVRHLHWLHAASHSAAVRRLIERSLGNPGAYRLSEERHALLIAAGEAGARVPTTQPVRNVADLVRWSRENPLPWVIKADGSWAGLGVRTVTSLHQAEQAFHEMTKPVTTLHALREVVLEHDLFWLRPWLARTRPAVSIQQYIAGTPANIAVACWQGEVRGTTSVAALAMEHETGPSTVVRMIENTEMVKAASTVVRALGLSGFVGFDFVIERGTGAAYMIEMNPRSTPICHVRLGGRRDLVETIQSSLLQRTPRATQPCTTSDTIAFFPHAWRHDPTSPALHAAFHAVPWDEPDLVRELMKAELRDRYWLTRQMRRAWNMWRRPEEHESQRPAERRSALDAGQQVREVVEA